MGLYQTDKPMAAKYDLHNGQVIGEGGHSVSVLKVSARTGGDFAVKTLKRKSGLIDREVQEVKIFLSLKHPNVARLVEVFDTGLRLHLVMELLTGGELLDRLLDRGKYSEVDAAGAFSQMCEAINYLHT